MSFNPDSRFQTSDSPICHPSNSMLPIRTASLRQLKTARTFSRIRLSSTSTGEKKDDLSKSSPSQAKSASENKENSSTTTGKKTMAQLDEELRQKMAGLAGDGGEAGVELEDGQPVSMKRGVKNNMFRYI